MKESGREGKGKKQDARTRQTPDLSRDLIAAQEDTATGDLTELCWADRIVEDRKLDRLDGAVLRIENCVVKQVTFSGNVFRSVKLKDVRLIGCDLANVKMMGLHAVRVEFLDCRMTGFQAGEAKCQDLLIQNGDQRYSQFRFSTFERGEFDGCNFDDADFYGADLRGCRFQRCSLRNGEMSEVKLERADLRGSTVDGLRLNAKDVFGATVDASQALVFASLLGIRIE